MASDSPVDRGPSRSPRENYNPLNDDMVDFDPNFYEEDYEQPNSLGSSQSYDTDSYENFYGVTPPTNVRAQKRNKEKFRSQKIKEEKVVSAVDKVLLSRNNSANKDQFSTFDDVTIKIDNVDSPVVKRKGNKPFKHARGHERDEKATSHLSSGDSNQLNTPKTAFKIDSPNRYLCLNSKHIGAHSGDDASPVDELLVKRDMIGTPVECPKDRLEFYKNFTRIVNIPNSTRKEKKECKVSPMVRQISSELELWQNQVNDLIWLELQAYMSSRTMEEQDSYLSQAQTEVGAILQEIMDFKINLPPHLRSNSPKPIDKTPAKQGKNSTEPLNQEAEENLIIKLPADGKNEQILLVPGDSKASDDVFANPGWVGSRSYDNIAAPAFSENIYTSIEAQKLAMVQVRLAMNKLESVEQLYPTIKALGKAHPLYKSDEFQRQYNTLCVWYNTTRDLAHKLHLMSKILSIDQIEGVNWPWKDYECPEKLLQKIRNPEDVLTPTIRGTGDEDEDYEDEDDYGEEEATGEPNHRHVGTSGNDDPTVRVTDNSNPASTGTPKLKPLITNRNVKFDVNDTSLALSPTDASTPVKDPASNRQAILFPRMVSSVSLEELTAQSIYHYFADRMLKKTGLRKMMERLKKVLNKTLCRAREGLEKPKEKLSYAAVTSQGKDTPNISRSSSPNRQGFRSRNASYGDISVSRTESNLSQTDYIGPEDFDSIGLPSYKPSYLFLVQIPLNVVHECLRLRLEQKPETEPSLLSVRQLIRECKEVMVGSVRVKKYYHDMVFPVTSDLYIQENAITEAFEEDMKEMLEVYFNYLQTWIFGLQKQPEMSKRLKNALQEEWDFIKDVCPYIRGGEANASNRFCTMASSLLRSISDYLEREMDECINNLYDVTSSVTEDLDTGDIGNSAAERRSAIISACRNFKVTFHEARERALKALGFAKMLRKDLEVAADFNIVATAKELLEKLDATGHYQVIAPHSAGYLMFVPNYIAENRTQILHLLNVTCGREDISFNSAAPADGYLLLVKCEGCADNQKTCPLWNGPTLKVEPTAETTIALSHIEVECLLLVVINSSQLGPQRRQFERLMGNSVQTVSENTSCHQAIADSLQELKVAALDLREKVADAISQVDEKLNLEDMPEMDEAEKMNLLTLYRETLHQCYNFGFEYHREVIRLISGDMREKLATVLVDFAKQWIRFVMEKCERGRGVKPRWANQGLDFLTVACNPKILSTLSNDEYEELKNLLYAVITHVVGDKGNACSPNASYRMNSPDILLQRQHGLFRNQSCPETRVARSISAVSFRSHDGHSQSVSDSGIKKSSSAECPRRVSIQTGEDGGLEMEVFTEESKGSPMRDVKEEDDYFVSRSEKILDAVQDLEQDVTNYLYSKNRIGRVINRHVEVDYHINIRRVNFKWQRGTKIGEGQFGKVYTAINIDNGEMVAMKSIQFQANDHQTIKNISDEIKRFEGISHPSLVKYYGVEIHRDEMLIFMEYCSEGTIAEVAKLGLPEAMVRKYTSELLVAVSVLHDHGIVHRDIKGANIFLTPSCLKLGDFGCSVQLRFHTTLPGEVNNVAGTAAYMAPEVITHSNVKGSGRAADVWSLGCVVIEMVTGKRPWHELETHFMIMFKVGMGGRPAVPEHLSGEGKDFLSHCFETNPDERWTASQLRDHPFVKVYTEEPSEDSPAGHL